jgi:RNA polymerase sigma-70 factor (ECF subfamily)
MKVAAATKWNPESAAAAALDAGDLARALTVLMEGYGVDVYRHCRQMLGDADLAAEVHQTVFIQAYRDLAGFGQRASFRSWLFAIARHRCLDACKMRHRLGRWLRQVTLPERPDPRPAADEALAARGASDALERALATLAPKVRAAVLLRFQEGMSYEEMAVVCGERAATLQARVARALPRLRRELEAMGVDG